MKNSFRLPWQRRGAANSVADHAPAVEPEVLASALPEAAPEPPVEDDSNDLATMSAVLSALNGDPEQQKNPDPAPPQSRPQTPPTLRIVENDTPVPQRVDAEDAPSDANPSKVISEPPEDSKPRMPRRPVKPTDTARPRVERPEPKVAEASVEAAIAQAAISAESDLEASEPVRSAPALAERAKASWTRWRPLRPFLVATLAPVPLMVLAGLFGGFWSLLALLWMTGLLFAFDQLALRKGISAPEPASVELADQLSLRLAGLHFVLLIFGIWVLSGATGLGFFSWVATFLAFGLWFGQVSNSNAHELIHRSNIWLFRTGMWVYISLLFGHHTSAHRLVHHRFVATVDDPNTAAAGENFYLFAARAWPGAFIAGFEMEQNLQEKRGSGLNPYTVYIAGGIGWIIAVLLAFGFDGLLAYLLVCAYAQVQLLLSDYVQHYGLLRREMPSGALEPAGIRHSWDAPHPISGLMMLNAPRHADHHAHPSRPYTQLRLSPGGHAPILPYSLPAMATIALIPRLWHRIMDRKLMEMRKSAGA